MAKITAVYLRVSFKSQVHASQEPDLRHWAKDHPNETIRWYRDKFTGKTTDCPGLSRLLADVEAGAVKRIVIWRLDRLGRTAIGLTALFEDLLSRKVNLVSLMDGLDLKPPTGRLVANVLASVAAYETELRAERIHAGQASAREVGKRWGGSAKGRRLTVTAEQVAQMRRMARKGAGVTAISRITGLSRPTIYRILGSETTVARSKRGPSKPVRKPRNAARG